MFTRCPVLSGLRYISYPNRDQQARPLDLAHVRDADILVCLEAADDPPAGAHDAHMAVRAAEEEAVGAGADAGDFVAVEKGARLVVFGELDLADVEEVEGFPLRATREGVSVCVNCTRVLDAKKDLQRGPCCAYRCLRDNELGASRIVVQETGAEVMLSGWVADGDDELPPRPSLIAAAAAPCLAWRELVMQRLQGCGAWEHLGLSHPCNSSQLNWSLGLYQGDSTHTRPSNSTSNDFSSRETNPILCTHELILSCIRRVAVHQATINLATGFLWGVSLLQSYWVKCGSHDSVYMSVQVVLNKAQRYLDMPRPF